MLFRDQPSGVLAISQLTHAWIAGQVLRAFDEPLSEPLLLACEQHDIAWLDWEAAPSFDPKSGRPHLFRDVGASVHAPLWIAGVNRALAAWGVHVALLVSRHGGVIYRRFRSRHQLDQADAAAAQGYLDRQAPLEAIWAQELGLAPPALDKETELLALADALSLALCGELKTPLELQAPGRNGEPVVIRLVERADQPFHFMLSPWPFRSSSLRVEGEARPLPAEGRFADEAAMRSWLATPERVRFSVELTPG
jgi:hypothetical protein